MTMTNLGTIRSYFVFFFQAEDGIRDGHVTGVQTCALPIFEDADRKGEGAGSEGERPLHGDLVPELPFDARRRRQKEGEEGDGRRIRQGPHALRRNGLHFHRSLLVVRIRPRGSLYTSGPGGVGYPT